MKIVFKNILKYFKHIWTFETNSKKDTIPSSLDVITNLKKTNVKKEIVAIGGINKNRIIKVLNSGAASICVSSAITLSDKPSL